MDSMFINMCAIALGVALLVLAYVVPPDRHQVHHHHHLINNACWQPLPEFYLDEASGNGGLRR